MGGGPIVQVQHNCSRFPPTHITNDLPIQKAIKARLSARLTKVGLEKRYAFVCDRGAGDRPKDRGSVRQAVWRRRVQSAHVL